MKKVYLLIAAALLAYSTAWAVDVVSFGGNTYVTPHVEGNDYSFDNESDATAAAINTWKNDGGELKLLKDEISCTLVGSGQGGAFIYGNCTLDLNGKKLHIETSRQYVFYVNAKYDNGSSILGSLTIKGNGTLEGTTSNGASRVSLIYLGGKNQPGVGKLSSSLLIESGIFKMECTGNESTNCCDVSFGANLSNTQINIAGGTFYDNISISANNPVYKPFSAGLFKQKPASANLKDCRSVTDEPDADGFYHVVEADVPVFAKIGDTEYSDVTAFNTALSEDESNPTSVILMPVQTCSPVVTIDAGKFVNIKQPSTSTQNNVSIINNGTINFYDESSQIMTWNNVTFENNGTIYLKKGDFTPSVFEYLTQSKDEGGVGASVPEGYVACNYTFLSNTYKRIYTTDEIVATITTDGNINGYASVAAAINQSSEESPAVLVKDNAVLSLSMLDPLINSGEARYLDLNGKTLTHSLSIKIFNGSLNIIGAGTINYTGTTNETELTTSLDNGVAFSLKGSNDATVTLYTGLSIGKDVTVNAIGGYGIGIFGSDSDTHSAYGVNVDIAGKINAKQMGVTINGGVNKISGAPVINVKNGAIINATCESGACIYAAGYGNWTIGAATLKASTPIYAKSGSIIVNGATIEACGAYAAPVANSNGFNPTGDAIMIDSHESYAGDVILSVSGNSTITSENGYAIQEALTKMDKTKAIGLAIVGGSFAGAKGSVKLSDEFAKALADGSTAEGWTLNAVTGGKYTSKPAVVADGYEVVELSGEHPFLYGVVNKTATSYITNYFEDKAEFLTFTVERGNEYVVRTGHTVNIGTLNIGDDASYPARVRIQPKGTLVVGDVIINNNKGAESLIVESDVTGYGMLLFNSNTVTNPFGTVEMYSHARILNAENGQYLFQHFGLPVYSEGAYITKNVPAAYSAWDIKKGWGYVSSDVVLNNGPWTGSNETPNSLYAGSMFSFSGVLVGNSDAEYNISSSEYGYKCFANSYSAPMSMTELMDQYNNPAVTDGTVWVFKASDYEKRGKEFVQWVYAEAAEENAAIDPLQAFFVLHQSSTDDSFTVNYKNAVYDFNKGLNGDVKGAEAVTIDNKGKITITDGNSTATLNLYESQDLSDDFDMNYDGYQMETGNIQIYVSLGGKKWSSFGSNSFDGKEITIVSKEASQITMSFSKLGGKAFKLTDMASGAEVEVGSDKTYTFTVEPNATAVRFKLGEGEVSANEADANDAVNIWSNNGNIFVANNIAEADIEIINLSGVKVAGAKASGEAVQAVSISNLASGVYVVRVGNANAKIVK